MFRCSSRPAPLRNCSGVPRYRREPMPRRLGVPVWDSAHARQVDVDDRCPPATSYRRRSAARTMKRKGQPWPGWGIAQLATVRYSASESRKPWVPYGGPWGQKPPAPPHGTNTSPVSAPSTSAVTSRPMVEPNGRAGGINRTSSAVVTSRRDSPAACSRSVHAASTAAVMLRACSATARVCDDATSAFRVSS